MQSRNIHPFRRSTESFQSWDVFHSFIVWMWDSLSQCTKKSIQKKMLIKAQHNGRKLENDVGKSSPLGGDSCRFPLSQRIHCNVMASLYQSFLCPCCVVPIKIQYTHTVLTRSIITVGWKWEEIATYWLHRTDHIDHTITHVGRMMMITAVITNQ